MFAYAEAYGKLSNWGIGGYIPQLMA